MPTGKSPRECGECGVCCTILGVATLGKAPGQECLEMMRTPTGMCGIYPERPEECRPFLCAWMQTPNPLDDRDRPDRCGIMLVDAGADSPFTIQTGMRALIAHEVFPSASTMYHGDRLLKKLARKIPLVVVPFGGLASPEKRRFLAPPRVAHIMRKFLTRSHK